jgi:hypothetical protein
LKRSRSVPLIVIGTAVVLTGCGQNDEPVQLQQQTYHSLDDCKKDWGDSKNCSPNTTGSGSSAHVRGSYDGPRYYWDREIGQPVAVDAAGGTRPVSGTRITEASGGTMVKGRFTGLRSAHGGFGGMAHGFASAGG